MSFDIVLKFETEAERDYWVGGFLDGWGENGPYSTQPQEGFLGWPYTISVTPFCVYCFEFGDGDGISPVLECGCERSKDALLTHEERKKNEKD